MELTKKELEEVRFKTKGKWYDAIQVDDFIDGVIHAADELNAEKDKQDEDMLQLQQENYELKQECEKLKTDVASLNEKISESPLSRATVGATAAGTAVSAAQNASAFTAANESVSSAAELDAQKAKLIEEIKLLKKFRDEFKSTLKGDAEDLISRLSTLGSDDLL